MTSTLLVLTLLGSTIAAFQLGRRRSLQLSGDHIRNLHSLPNHYGFYAALWCGIPALVILGIWQAFATDQAGLRIQQEWRLLRDAARDSELRMDWNSFRAWLGAALEKHDFRPALASGAVWLLNLKQARLGRFAGIVIGACDSEYLPPAPARSPFFNDRVRSELGLPAWPERHQRQLQQFRALLESAPRVLLTWHREQNGELRTPAAWLARLEVFHRLAWAHGLQDPTLPALLDHPGTQVAGHHPPPPPGFHLSLTNV